VHPYFPIAVGAEDSMENSNEFKDRRRYPRSVVDLPFEYRMKNLPDAYGGLVVNASEGGLLIHSVKDMPVGLELRMVVLFPDGYELADFEVLAAIVWKDLYAFGNSEGYRHGLRIVQILEGDRWKLKQLLNSLGRARSSITFSAQPNTPPPE